MVLQKNKSDLGKKEKKKKTSSQQDFLGDASITRLSELQTF